MDKAVLGIIENKLNSHPGFWEGLLEVSHVFTFENESQVENIWDGVANYLKNFQYHEFVLSKDGVGIRTIHPFTSEEDFRIAKLVIFSYKK